MRKHFVQAAQDMLLADPATVVLLGDIGVHGFRDAFDKVPERIYNIGILEQATIGMASGMALAGMKPIVHTIAPFLVERAYEQLKIDFAYQKVKGIFVSVGGSYDYSGLGCTHHCPADVSLIENLDSFGIFVPGHPDEVGPVMQRAAKSGCSCYIRLSETSNRTAYVTDASKALGPVIVRPNLSDYGPGPTVLAVGPCLDMVLEATEGLPVTVLYTAAVRPFPSHELKLETNDIIVVEPYYSSHLANRIAGCNSTPYRPISARSFSLPRRSIEEYGDRRRIEINMGFYAHALRVEISQWIKSPTSSAKTPLA